MQRGMKQKVPIANILFQINIQKVSVVIKKEKKKTTTKKSKIINSSYFAYSVHMAFAFIYFSTQKTFRPAL